MFNTLTLISFIGKIFINIRKLLKLFKKFLYGLKKIANVMYSAYIPYKSSKYNILYELLVRILLMLPARMRNDC